MDMEDRLSDKKKLYSIRMLKKSAGPQPAVHEARDLRERRNPKSDVQKTLNFGPQTFASRQSRLAILRPIPPML
jgi:hypothetical protein